MKRISKEFYKELEKLGLIDLTKNNSNCYTTCNRKNKYICEQVLVEYEEIKETILKLKEKHKNKFRVKNKS